MNLKDKRSKLRRTPKNSCTVKMLNVNTESVLKSNTLACVCVRVPLLAGAPAGDVTPWLRGLLVCVCVGVGVCVCVCVWGGVGVAGGGVMRACARLVPLER